MFDLCRSNSDEEETGMESENYLPKLKFQSGITSQPEPFRARFMVREGCGGLFEAG